MKRTYRWALVALALLLAAATGILTACDGIGGGTGGDSLYTADDIRYVSTEGEEVAVVAGRTYTKANGGVAAVALAYINGYTGPVLVGKTAAAVSYIFQYYGANVVNEYGTITVGDEVWYYSSNVGFMSGNYLSFGDKGPIYCSRKETAEDVAKELVSLLDKSRVAAKEILTAEDLLAIAHSADSYVLGADIDLSAVTDWQPIEGFKGSLNGCGHTLSGLTVSAVNKENAGLFRVLEGTVENLTIETAQISSRGDAGRVGIVAGTNKGIIKNVTVDGSVSAKYGSKVGGIAGANESGRILNCRNTATVEGATDTGGIVGNAYIDRSEGLSGCVNEGTVTGTDAVGGIAGFLSMPEVSSNVTYTVSGHTNNGAVTGKNKVGGIFGDVYGMFHDGGYWSDNYGHFDMSDLTNNAAVTGDATGEHVGGLVGKAIRLTTLSLCDNTGDVTGGTAVGGFVGYAPDTTIRAMGAENNSTISGRGKVGGFAGEVAYVEGAVNNGSVILTGVLIENGESYAYVGGIAGYCNGVNDCRNTADITVQNGLYTGGIAGYISTTENDKANGNRNVGAITGTDAVGGIAGYIAIPGGSSNYTLTVSDNENSGAVTGKNAVGGVFGWVAGAYFKYYGDFYRYFDMSLLTNGGEVVGTGNNVGGLIGKADRLSVLSVCRNTADVTGVDRVGGFVGNAPDTTIRAMGETNESTITGRTYVGGFAGVAGIIENASNDGQIVTLGSDADGNTYLGGIAGYCTGALECVNHADIQPTRKGKYIGGIAGYVSLRGDKQVKGNQNFGAVTGADAVGGIAGCIEIPGGSSKYTLTVSDNKNAGAVTGKTGVGGIFGEANGAYFKYYGDFYRYIQVENCQNDAQISGTSWVGGIVGKYTYMKTDENIMATNTTTYGEKLGTA